MQQNEICNYYKCKCLEICHCKTSGNIGACSDPYHDTYELYYLISGEQYFFIKDRTYYIKPGDLIFVDTGVLHRIIPGKTPAYESIKVNFTQKFFNHFMEEILAVPMPVPLDGYAKVIRFSDDNQIIVENIFRKIMKECGAKKRGHALYIKILMIELFIFIIRALEESPQPELAHPSSMHGKIADITYYINENYNKDISLISLSKKFDISPYYLSRIFKEATGFSYSEYLNTVRIKKAKQLLKETEFNISQIAKEIGYNNINQFGRIFKNATGLPPSSFRKSENI